MTKRERKVLFKKNASNLLILVISTMLLLWETPSFLFAKEDAKTDAIASKRLPPEIKGLVKDGETVECRNLSELTRQINGAAPFYIERGVKKVIFQDYTDSHQKSIRLEIYEMGSAEQAKILYKDIYVESPAPVEKTGDAARMAERLIGAYALDFISASTYSKLTILEKSPEAKTELITVAREVAEALR